MASRANSTVPRNKGKLLKSPTTSLFSKVKGSLNRYHKIKPKLINVIPLATVDKGASSFKFLIQFIRIKGIRIASM